MNNLIVVLAILYYHKGDFSNFLLRKIKHFVVEFPIFFCSFFVDNNYRLEFEGVLKYNDSGDIMLLVFDVGNTNIKLGLFDGDDLVMIARTSTDASKTGDELAIEIKGIFEVYDFDITKVQGTIISSVVPQVLVSLKRAVKLLFKEEPLVVGPGLKTGINIRIDNPSSAGADLVTGCVGAAEMYKLPCIVISMGTATTVFVVDKEKSMIGGAIIPGVGTSLNALVKQGALLPSIAIQAPHRVIGKNTDECMRSGIVIGTASMIDGMIDRMQAEIGEECSLVATGGLAAEIVPSCAHKIELRDDLMLQGLKILYDKNKIKT